MSLFRAAIFLAGAWSAAAATAAAAAPAITTFPQIVEVDLIFPRNETYAPASVFPIVFAYQNPYFLPTISPNLQDIGLWPKSIRDDAIETPELDLSLVNINSSGPHYVYTYALNINTTNAGSDALTQYRLVWTFGASNCSESALAPGGASFSRNIMFTIAKEGGTTPSINTTDDASSCNELPHFAYNITGTMEVPSPYVDTWGSNASCAELSDTTPKPAGNPCAATANAAVAASLMASATNRACAAASPSISCPAKSAGVLSGSPIPVYMVGAWAILALAIAV